jgi:hypothetical protein
MRFPPLLAITVAWAQTNDSSSPETRAMQDLAGVPNYVCVDSIERSLWIPGERQFRRLDRVHVG